MDDKIRVEEQEHLTSCLSQIDQIIRRNEEWKETPATTSALVKEPARKFLQMRDLQTKNLQEAKPSPYIGRVDFEANDLVNKETYYFGKYGIPEEISPECPEPIVISFGAPAYDLYAIPLSGKYRSMTGLEITGKVRLKRRIIVEDSKLIDCMDYKLTREDETKQPEDVALSRELSRPKGVELTDIIATVKPEQYEQIAAAWQQVNIIHGVAGSGKSEIGLHRIVYLVSQQKRLALQISPERIFLFGPSKPFLKYISNLLPSFHIYKVRQITFRDWIIKNLSSHIRLERKDGLLEKLLHCKDTTALKPEIEVARFKGSVQS